MHGGSARTFQRLIPSAALLLVILSFSRPSDAQPMFTGIGDLPGGAVSSHAAAISADGTAVVGHSSSALGSSEAFRWTAADGMLPLGDIEGGLFRSRAVGVSDDGSVVVGVGVNDQTSYTDESFLWSADDGLVRLGGIGYRSGGGTYGSIATAISGDGTVVVGMANVWGRPRIRQFAFEWTEADGMSSLGELSRTTYGSSEALAVSDSRSQFSGRPLVVGESDSPNGREAFTNIFGALGVLPGATSFESAATAVSSRGSIVTGWSSSVGGATEAFLWEFEAEMAGLGRDLGPTCGYPEAITGDGSVIVGYCADDDRPWIWTELNGMRLLEDEFAFGGLDFTGWTLQRATDIADDGLTIVGWGVNPGGQPEGWIATLPVQARLEIDILPGSPDPGNTSVHGELPVAILGSDDVDVTTFEVTSLRFGPGNGVPIHEQQGHVEDINDDGRMDLVSHYNTHDAGLTLNDDPYSDVCVTVTRNDGRRLSGCDRVSIVVTSFLETSNVASAEAVLAHIGDFDGDGDPDVVAAIEAEGYVEGERSCSYFTRHPLHDVVWFENVNGRGLFGPAKPLLSDLPEVTALTLGDLNGDGSLDLIVGTALEEAVHWYENEDGLGSLGLANTIATNLDFSREIELADFDRDGDLDLFWSGQKYRECIHNEGTTGWFENTDSLGSFSDFKPLIAAGLFSIEVVDFEGDGDLDVFVEPWHLPAQLLINTGGDVQFAIHQIDRSDICGWPFLIDIDDDADTDMVCDEEVYTTELDDNGEAGFDIFGYGGIGSRSVTTAAFDVDLDGDTDYLHPYIGAHHAPDPNEQYHALGLYLNEQRVDPYWEGSFIPQYRKAAGLFAGPTYQDPFHDDYFEYRDVLTATHIVDMDMDSDLDVVIVAGGIGRIFWFANSLLTPEPTVPIAAAGEDQLVVIGERVGLDGGASHDLESDPLIYQWSIITSPEDSVADLDDAATDAPSFVPDVAGEYEIELIVSDAFGSSAPDTVAVSAITAQAYVEMKLLQAKAIIAGLAREQVVSVRKQKHLLKRLRVSLGALEKPDFSRVIWNVDRVLTKTDGCIANGTPDGPGADRDTIVDCESQVRVFGLLREAIDALAPELSSSE